MEEVKKNNWIAIRCPKCKYEYLMQDIFYPDDFCGTTKNVIRDVSGKIIYADYKDGHEPTFVQHFTCDNCEKQFVVEAVLSFKVKAEAEEFDFANQSVSLID